MTDRLLCLCWLPGSCSWFVFFFGDNQIIGGTIIIAIIIQNGNNVLCTSVHSFLYGSCPLVLRPKTARAITPTFPLLARPRRGLHAHRRFLLFSASPSLCFCERAPARLAIGGAPTTQLKLLLDFFFYFGLSRCLVQVPPSFLFLSFFSEGKSFAPRP